MSKVAIKGNASGTGTFTLEAPNSNTDRTLTLPDEAGTVLTSASDITQNSGPAFHAYNDTAGYVTFSLVTDTKVAMDQTLFDTDSCWDGTNYLFTPTVAGYYWLHGSVEFNWTGSNPTQWEVGIYKNPAGGLGNSQGGRNHKYFSGTYYGSENVSALVYFNGTTDNAGLYIWATGGSNPVYNTGSFFETYFTGYLVRAA